jgi:transcriptional regulator with XRE-family HTH domain
MITRTETLLTELKEWCDEKRGRQTEVALAMGVSRQIVNFWLKRRSNPTSEQTLAIIAFLENPEAFRKPGRGLAKK